MPAGKLYEKNMKKMNFFAFLKSLKKGVRGMDQRIGIRTKMSWIPNTGR